MTKYLRELNDPELNEAQKISSKEHFELVYMRHRYFRQSINPEPKRLAQFEEMLCNISDKIYFKNISVFSLTGFEQDDLRNIARINTVSFISMGGLAENPDKAEEFRQRHKQKYGQDSEPKEDDIFRKECYDLAKFLNQRLQEVAGFCKNKNKNIRGTKDTECFFIGPTNKDPDDLSLFYQHEQFGFIPITSKQYKKLVKKNKPQNKQNFLLDDNRIRAVYLQGSYLNKKDIEKTNLDPRENSFYKNPEELLMDKEFIL